MSYFQITEEDINNLKQKLEGVLGEGYEVETHKEVSALMGAIKETFDLVIFYHGDAICGIEYKMRAFGSIFRDRFEAVYINKLRRVGLKYGFAYFNGEKGGFFWTEGSYHYEYFSFENMAIAIKGNQSCGERLLPNETLGVIMGLMPQELIDDLSENQLNVISGLFADKTLNYDEKSASMWLNSYVEDEFFKALLFSGHNINEYDHICRYTSLNSLFLTMKNASHVMCSITCMNDKGETSYADKYVGYGACANSTRSIKENNDCFILSCCNKDMVDNLTMWRLYGNDGKGVCLEYDVDISKIDGKEFFLAPVSYGNAINEHPALDFIQKIRLWKKNGWCFELKRWYIWKHFFKSHLFKEENEVRLLYIWTEDSKDRVEWIMDSTNNIVSRICKFSMSDRRLPITLTNAIVGPKCPEQGSNVDQFRYMNSQTKTMTASLSKPAIRVSKIEDYR